MLTVVGEQPGCVTANDLRGRVPRYLAPGIRASDLQVEVDLERRPARFSVRRNGELVAERRFERLPAGCAERRDALALAIAVAIEHAAPPPNIDGAASKSAGPASGSSTSAGTTQPGAGASNRRAAADSAEQPSAAGTDSAEDSARQPPRAAGQPAAAAAAVTSQAEAQEEEDDGEPEYSGELPEFTDSNGPSTPWTRPSARWMGFGGAQLLFGALPSTEAVLAFTAGAEFAVMPELRVSLSGLFSLEQIQSLGQEVLTQLYGAQLLACLNTPFYSVIAAACAGAAGGVVRAEGSQAFDVNDETSMAWLAGAVRATLEFPADSVLAARVFADGRVNLVRPELEVAVPPDGYLRSAAPVFGGSLGAEIIVRLE